MRVTLPRSIRPTKTVGILLFDDVELATFSDAVTLFGAESNWTRKGSGPLFRPVLIAQSRRQVVCREGFALQPQATLSDHPSLDVLVTPGGRGHGWNWPKSRVVDQVDALLRPKGIGVRRERHNPQLLRWIREQSHCVEAVIGICSGTVLLAECGLLRGCQAMAHPQLRSWMHDFYPDVVLLPERTLVDAGRVITARGWKGAFQAAMRCISRTNGAAAAVSAASSIDPGHTWLLPALLCPAVSSPGLFELTE